MRQLSILAAKLIAIVYLCRVPKIMRPWSIKGFIEGEHLLWNVSDPILLPVFLCREQCKWNYLPGYAAEQVNAAAYRT